LEGGRGEDLISGSPGPDKIDPGPGEDSDPPNFVDGSRVAAGAGADTIRARDGHYDAIDCGPGTDRAFLDGDDLPTGHSCERIRRHTPARAIPVYLLGESFPLILNIGCPSDVPRRCSIVLITTTRDGRRASRERHAIPAGRYEIVFIHTPGKLNDVLERRGIMVKVVTVRQRPLPITRLFHFSLYEGE
jgi:hypothetical protein